MSTPPIKYNPAFLTDEELNAAFVVRHDDHDIILRTIRDNTTESNQHVLIIGPRGTGKTMLVQRLALTIREDEKLQEQWYPLIFAEESYEVGTAGEFWLEAIFHLANQTGNPQWTATYEELREEHDDDRLYARALAQLMDFADDKKKRIILFVENLNMILGEQISDDDAWKLRKTLMHEPRIMLMATATARLSLPENTNKAFFELLKPHELPPLNDDDCRTIWKTIAGHDLGPRRIRALSILTGGNPRLLTIISHFGKNLSFTDLMKELTGLVDDHTDYFKSHLEALPRTERKVYVALADLWDPSLARDVAKSARLEVSKTSSLLKRLVSRGAVTEIPGNGKKIRYRVTERMYNIYYLMRRRGAPSDRVRAAIDFMVKFYDETEILDITKKLGNEACSLACTERKLHYHAFEGIIKSVHPELQSKLLECAPEDFLKADDKPESLTNLLEELEAYKTDDSLTLINHILAKGVRAFMDGDLVRAEIEFQKAIDTAEKNSDAWICMAFLREETKQYDKAEDAYRNALELKPNDNLNWLWFGKLLREHTKDYIAAEKSFKKAIALNENNVLAWFHIAQLYQFNLKKYKQAEDAYIKVIKIDPEFSLAWAYMGILLHVNLSKISEAKKAYNNAIDSDKSNYIPRLGLIQIALRENTKDIDKPLKIADEAITDIPNNSDLLNLLAWTFINIYPRSLPSQILNWARKAVSIKKDETNILALACVLARNGHKEEALLCTKDLFNNDTLGEISAVNLATLFENLVLSGYAKETITILAESKHATRLEPILVALRMYSEEEVSVAPEIEKVARDILKMFQEADKRLLS